MTQNKKNGYSHSARLAVITIFLSFLVNSYVSAASTITIRVTGEGSSIYEAREEAIRQALQIAVRQLVVAQRVVQNDKLVLDKVSSTMNGFVNRFTIIKTEKIRGDIRIEAEVEVSDSRIENFVGGVSGSRSTISTDNILASIQNEKLLREARGQVAASLFGDFPGRAIKPSPVKLSLAADNPDDLIYQTELKWDPVFLKTLTNGLKALGAKRKRCTWGSSVGSGDICGDYPQYPTILVCFAERMSLSTTMVVGRHNLRYDESGTDCWALEPADTSFFRPPVDGVSLLNRIKENPIVADGVFAAAIVANKATIQVQRSRIAAVAPGNPWVPGPPQGEFGPGGDVSPAFLMLWEGPHLTMIFNTVPFSITGRFSSSALTSNTRTLDVVPMVVRYTGEWRSNSIVSELFPRLYEARTRDEIDAYINKLILEMVPDAGVK